MKFFLFGCVAALLLASQVSAAKPEAAGTISGPNEAAPYAFADEVTFTTSVSGLKGTQYPLVYVECLSAIDEELLYGQLDLPDAVFVLGADSSEWHTDRDDADCTATLFAYGGKGQTPQIVELDSVSFSASG